MLGFGEREPRVLLIAADRALLFVGPRRLEHAYEFANSESGWNAFATYLQQAPNTPLRVLVDVVEEEYRQDTVPHVRGADRRAVLSRKFARLFRSTPYSLALFQGRENDGRRDDRVLLTALTKPDTLTPWISQILSHRVPLAGIWSLPVLSQALLGKLQAKSSNVLFISVQQASGLRQTFFRDGHLKISRLAQMPRIGAVPYASYLLAELAKLRRYLSSLALISRDSPLAIYLLSHGALLQDLETHCKNTDGEHYYLVDTEEFASRLGLPASLATPYADALFAQLLLTDAPKEHYAQAEESRYFRLHQANLGLIAASLLLLVGSAGWSGLRLLEAVGLKQQAQDAAQKSVFYRERFALARRDLPPTVVEASAIKTAVEAVATLRELKASPVSAWQLLGAALSARPTITLDELRWYRTFDPNQDPAHTEQKTDAKIPLSAEYRYYAVSTLAAHFDNFAGDYRAAIAQIDELAAALRAEPTVHHVEVENYPVDLRPAATVSGTSEIASGNATAAFTLRLIIGVPHAVKAG